MVEINVRYLGDLRCEATHGPSGATLLSDAPVDNQGKGESFSPTDLVATALGTCVLTIMGILAQRHGWDISGATVKVVKEMITRPLRRIGKLTVSIHVPRELPAEARRALEAGAHTCPVHKSLLDEIDAPLLFHYGEKMGAGE